METPLEDRFIQQIVRYLDAKEGEPVLIIGDDASAYLTEAVGDILETSNLVAKINMDYGYQRPLTELPQRLVELINDFKPVKCLYALEKNVGGKSELPFRQELNALLGKKGTPYGNFLSPRKHIIEEVFSVDAGKVIALTDAIAAYMTENVSEALITSPAGTHLKVHFKSYTGTEKLPPQGSGTYKWIAASGLISNEHSGNLMPAEVYTYPADSQGTVVVDGGYSLLYETMGFEAQQELLRAEPLVFTIRDNRIVGIDGPATVVDQVYELLGKNEFNDRMGEIGLPANPVLAGCKGHVGRDEKALVHCANGHGYPDKTGAPDYRLTEGYAQKYGDKRPTHQDFLLLDGSVYDLNNDFYVIKDNRQHETFLESAGF